MSAFVVGKVHVDLLVRAALHAYPAGSSGVAQRLSWWRVDGDGGYAGWRELHPLAESMASDEHRAYYAPSQLGQILVSENVASVAHRYSDAGRVPYYGAEASAGMADLADEELPGPCDRYYLAPYVYADPGRDLSAGEVFKAIDCLDYQSCEHPGWRCSEAFAFLTALREAYCRRVDGYESSPREFCS